MKPALIFLPFCWCASEHQQQGHHSHFQTSSEHHHHLRSVQAKESGSHPFCGTPDLTENDRASLDKALGLRKLKKRNRQQQQEDIAFQANSPKVIPVCFHVVGLRQISKRQLDKELAALNKGYSSKSCCDTKFDWCDPAHACSEPTTNIRFVMAKAIRGKLLQGTVAKPTSPLSCVRRWPFPTIMSPGSGAERRVKKALRLGGMDVLNIYYGFLLPAGLLGYSYFPSIALSDPILDGVVMTRSVLVGKSKYPDYNEGDTVVHESGHWLGLPHTFGNGDGDCAKGDGIADTPAEAFPNFGCPIGTDSCLMEEGLDPIHNFMDYANNTCMYEWTQGQVDAMHASFDYYRTGKPMPVPIQLSDGVASTGYAIGRGELLEFNFSVSSKSDVWCRISADNGDVDLYTNTNGRFDYFDCVSESARSLESCVIQGEVEATIFLFVLAWSATTDMSVACSKMTAVQSTLIDIALDESLSGINFNQGVVQGYRLAAPSNNQLVVECNTTGSGTADVEMLMSDYETFYYYSCASATIGSANESCHVFYYGSNIYIWLLFAATSPNSVTLVCNTRLWDDVIELSDGIESQEYLIKTYSSSSFYLKVDHLALVSCETKSSRGDLRLAVSWYDISGQGCFSDHYNTSNENCAIPIPGKGYALATVDSYPSPSGPDFPTNFTITCTTQSFSTTTLTDGAPLSAQDLNAGNSIYFSINVPTLSYLLCFTTGDNGDVDLVLAWDDALTNSCYSGKSGSNEVCTIGPKSGLAVASVYASSDTTDYAIECTIVAI